MPTTTTNADTISITTTNISNNKRPITLYSRELDLHKGIASDGRDDDAREANNDKQDAVEFGGGG